MSLKVVGAGVGRTGTHSLKLALQILLGEPCYHMVEVFEHPEHVPAWHAAAKGEPVDWDALMIGYAAAVDWPAGAFWPEISAAFPEALVVLSIRDSEAWWRSTQNTIFNSLNRKYPPEMSDWRAMVDEMFASRFTTELDNHDACVAAFEKHNAEVKRRVPANKLLIWTASDGWEPLCKALNLPIPSEPFPVTNTTEEFQKRVSEREAARAATV